MMKSGYYKGRIDKAEDCSEQNLKGACNSGEHYGGDNGAYLPPDGSQDKMGGHDCQQ